MKKNKSFLFVSTVEFNLYINNKVFSQIQRFNIPKGLFRSIGNMIKKIDVNSEFTFYSKEFDVLFTIEKVDDISYVFTSVNPMNYSNGVKIRQTKNQEFLSNEPIFFKSYYNGKKIYLNKQVPAIMKKNSIEPHLISFDNVNLRNGLYSSFLKANGNYVMEFYVENGHILITDIIKPDYVRFGVSTFNF